MTKIRIFVLCVLFVLLGVMNAGAKEEMLTPLHAFAGTTLAVVGQVTSSAIDNRSCNGDWAYDVQYSGVTQTVSLELYAANRIGGTYYHTGVTLTSGIATSGEEGDGRTFGPTSSLVIPRLPFYKIVATTYTGTIGTINMYLYRWTDR